MYGFILLALKRGIQCLKAVMEIVTLNVELLFHQHGLLNAGIQSRGFGFQ
ncbi:MAG: hypothetical protein IJ719_22305 [Clostridia bacterium]|nr:hypothetical protein [Clostridia bacterium]